MVSRSPDRRAIVSSRVPATASGGSSASPASSPQSPGAATCTKGRATVGRVPGATPRRGFPSEAIAPCWARGTAVPGRAAAVAALAPAAAVPLVATVLLILGPILRPGPLVAVQPVRRTRSGSRARRGAWSRDRRARLGVWRCVGIALGRRRAGGRLRRARGDERQQLKLVLDGRGRCGRPWPRSTWRPGSSARTARCSRGSACSASPSRRSRSPPASRSCATGSTTSTRRSTGRSSTAR